MTINKYDSVTNNILDLAGAFLSSKNSLATQLRKMPQVYGDAIQVTKDERGIENSLSLSHPTTTSLWSLAGHIHQRLGHLIVNPSRRRDTEAVLGSYVFPAPNSSLRSVNRSPESVAEFVRRVNFAARQQLQIRKETIKLASNERLGSDVAFLLYGTRGCGKTSLINYIISEFQPRFDREDERVIWVRLNLAEDLYGSSKAEFDVKDLIKWIYAQVTKVVLRYYDSNSRHFIVGKPVHFSQNPSDDLRAHFMGLAKDVPVEVRDRYISDTIQRLDMLLSAMFDQGKEAPISDALIDPPWAKHIYEFVQSENYSVVVVFDGLDIMEATLSARHKFRSIHAAIKALLKTDDHFGASYVITMRTSTLAKEGDPHGLSAPIALEVVAVPFSEIVERRLGFISKEVRVLSQDAYDHWISENIYLHWPSHLEQFREYISSTSDDEATGTDYISLFGNNRRAQMQLLQFAYLEFLANDRKQPYRLIETMMKSGRTFPPKHYSYSTNARGRAERSFAEDLRGDTRFLPSLFSFPVVLGYPLKGQAHFLDQLMMGLRIIQLVDAHEYMIANSANVGPLKAPKIGAILNKAFGYDTNIVDLLVTEYEEFEIIRTTGRHAVGEPEFGENDVRAMPKLEYIKDNLLDDIAYINLAAMRAVLPVQGLAQVAGHPLVRSAHFGGDQRELGSWIRAKVVNSVGIGRLIFELDQEQSKKYSAVALQIADRDKEAGDLLSVAVERGMFRVGMRIRNSILNGVGRALASAGTSSANLVRYDRIADDLSQLIARWR